MNDLNFISVLLNPTHRFSRKKRQFPDELIETHFHDWEALSLLAGISNIPRARKIWYKYFDNFQLTEEEIKFAHDTANKLKAEHGDAILNLLLSCPPKPFQIDDAKELFSELDLATAQNANPTIRFISTEKEKFRKVFMHQSYDPKLKSHLIPDTPSGGSFTKEKHKFSISFWNEKGDNNLTKSKDVVVLRNVTMGKNLAHIQRNGEFNSIRGAYIPKPVISLFLKVCKDPRAFIINYGIVTGNCSYCNQELTHPTSKKRNYGKKCANDRNLPW